MQVGGPGHSNLNSRFTTLANNVRKERAVSRIKDALRTTPVDLAQVQLDSVKKASDEAVKLVMKNKDNRSLPIRAWEALLAVVKVVFNGSGH